MATRYVLLLKGNVPRDLNVINLTIHLETTTNANPKIGLYWTELPYHDSWGS